MLICEDPTKTNSTFRGDLEYNFQNYTILHTSSLGHALKSAQPVIESLKLVFTDRCLGMKGKLKDEGLVFETGLDLARNLRQINYKGPIILTDFFLPEEYKSLFNGRITKTDTGSELIHKLNQYLK